MSYIQGNTLIDLAPPASEHRSIALDGANAVIVNNLLIASPDCAGGTLRCVGVYDGGSVSALRGNAFVGFSGTNGFVYANSSVSAKLPSDVPNTVRRSGNLSYDSRALAGLPDVDIRPLPTSNLIARGHDPNAFDCGVEAGACGGSLTALDGTARPNPPTIGALEP